MRERRARRLMTRDRVPAGATSNGLVNEPRRTPRARRVPPRREDLPWLAPGGTSALRGGAGPPLAWQWQVEVDPDRFSCFVLFVPLVVAVSANDATRSTSRHPYRSEPVPVFQRRAGHSLGFVVADAESGFGERYLRLTRPP